MKRSEMVQAIVGTLTALDATRQVRSYEEKAEDLLRLIENAGMLPPERPDESPTGYGAAYLDDEDVAKNYYKFKHSWESEDETK